MRFSNEKHIKRGLSRKLISYAYVINLSKHLFLLETKIAMKRLPFLLLILFFISACDDGDIIEFELDFNDDLELCDDSESSYLLYNIKGDPFESLTLLVPKNASTNEIFNPSLNSILEFSQQINGTSSRFNYRTYNGDPNGLICRQVIDPDVRITNDYPAASGATAIFRTSFVDDDNDGVPSEIENPNNDDYENAPDSDGDGLPDYVDADDDNDNVLTRNELGDYDDTGIFLDTDEDSIPDYLDSDDDGDGTLTRLEDASGNQDPRDDYDTDDSVNINIPRYLDPLVSQAYPDSGVNVEDVNFNRAIRVTVTISNAAIGVLRTNEIFMGVLTYSEIIKPFEEED